MNELQHCPDCGFCYEDPRYHMLSGCLTVPGGNQAAAA